MLDDYLAPMLDWIKITQGALNHAVLLGWLEGFAYHIGKCSRTELAGRGIYMLGMLKIRSSYGVFMLAYDLLKRKVRGVKSLISLAIVTLIKGTKNDDSNIHAHLSRPFDRFFIGHQSSS